MAKRQPATNNAAFVAMIRDYLAVHPSMTEQDFAEAIGMDQGAFSRLLKNRKRRPEAETVVAVARLLGVREWVAAVAAGYPFSLPEVPSDEDVRLLAASQADPRMKDVLLRRWHEVSPDRRESVLRMVKAILDEPNDSPQHQSPSE